ncbi:hypothetical protein OsI_15975 [Oryza sativa Indica Group]|uniref:Uncharacterized protein n=2 Tax=Oryza sativa TaxID=4530 RepID=B9FFA6_ORYSJ|nr:hypothetical protein OsI_15975 [Oryza sativa Indica Group]EEE61040.1 hypothetical protein OsJ_14881 [Oryza sativa Japonica Group]
MPGGIPAPPCRQHRSGGIDSARRAASGARLSLRPSPPLSLRKASRTQGGVANGGWRAAAGLGAVPDLLALLSSFPIWICLDVVCMQCGDSSGGDSGSAPSARTRLAPAPRRPHPLPPAKGGIGI